MRRPLTSRRAAPFWVERARTELTLARERLLALLLPIPRSELLHQHSALMSPAVWDVAHIANYEEQWLVRSLGAAPLRDRLDGLYDALRHPRPTRSNLPLLGVDEAFRYAAEVRERTLELLDGLVEGQSPSRLLDGGFVYGMAAQHEQQHVETLLATLQLVTRVPLEPPAGTAHTWSAPPLKDAHGEVRVPGGPVVLGSDEAWAYDNERPAHSVTLPDFFIDRTPVSNGDFSAFIEAGGYRSPALWTPAGWEHRVQAALEHPAYWRRSNGCWERRRFGLWEPLPLSEPVAHVCFYEAEAYARWAHRRLPTEAEWEKAARWSPEGTRCPWPWGDGRPSAERANLWPLAGHPLPIGSFPRGASASGALGLIGDVWEWTSSDFQPYPGFEAFPYPEYSVPFFGNSHKVLRGGSWAVAPVAIRVSFRNWDLPIRRQIFAGFRCARDA